eukprot:1158448-Pelagomonas_calceolata.AAC.9
MMSVSATSKFQRRHFFSYVIVCPSDDVLKVSVQTVVPFFNVRWLASSQDFIHFSDLSGVCVLLEG